MLNSRYQDYTGVVTAEPPVAELRQEPSDACLSKRKPMRINQANT